MNLVVRPQNCPFWDWGGGGDLRYIFRFGGQDKISKKVLLFAHGVSKCYMTPGRGDQGQGSVGSAHRPPNNPKC